MSGYQKIENNLLIEGNITITGTVNTRDVGTDGINLDNHIAASSSIHGILGSVVGTTDIQTLTNKTLNSAVLNLPTIDDTSSNHKYIFGVSELTADRIISLPLLTGNDTFVFAAHNQTLTNKTINTANNTLTIAAGDITSGTLSDSLVASSNITQHEGSITIGNLIGAPTGSVVGTTDTQTLTNKTLTAPTISTITNGGTLTLPSTNDTLVGRATADTLTNKTISSSTNTVGATELRTTGASVNISSAAPPNTGQILKATSTTTASWQNVTTSGGYKQLVETTIGTGSTTAENDLDITPTITSGAEIATLNITPNSASNRIFLNWHFLGDISADRAYHVFLFRGPTLIGIDQCSGFKRDHFGICNGSFLDNPVTTSSITYSLRVAIEPSGTIYWGQTKNGETLNGSVASKQFFYAGEVVVG